MLDTSHTLNFLVHFGESYTELFANYNLLSTDYGGYSWSTPTINCFVSEEERKASVAAESPFSSVLRAQPISTRGKPARDLAQRCRKNASRVIRVIRYSSSYTVAVDAMKAMVQDRIGFRAAASGAVVAHPVAFLPLQYVEKSLLDAPAPWQLDYTTTAVTAKTIEGLTRCDLRALIRLY